MTPLAITDPSHQWGWTDLWADITWSDAYWNGLDGSVWVAALVAGLVWVAVKTKKGMK